MTTVLEHSGAQPKEYTYMCMYFCTVSRTFTVIMLGLPLTTPVLVNIIEPVK